MPIASAPELLFPEGVELAGHPTQDARTAALDRLKLYVSLLRFFRKGDKGGPPVEFRVPLENVLEEWPDADKDLRLPAVAFLAAPGVHEPVGLGPPVLCEESVGVFGPNTALEQTGTYREELGIEAWAHGKAERRALVAGLQLAMTGAAGSYAIRMKLPAYYGQIATFVLDETVYSDDPDVARGRRRAILRVTMTVPEVRLVRYPDLRVLVEVVVADRGRCGDPIAVASEI
jgi:hypothetical protein